MHAYVVHTGGGLAKTIRTHVCTVILAGTSIHTVIYGAYIYVVTANPACEQTC